MNHEGSSAYALQFDVDAAVLAAQVPLVPLQASQIGVKSAVSWRQWWTWQKIAIASGVGLLLFILLIAVSRGGSSVASKGMASPCAWLVMSACYSTCRKHARLVRGKTLTLWPFAVSMDIHVVGE